MHAQLFELLIKTKKYRREQRENKIIEIKSHLKTMTSHWYSISEIKKIIKRHDKEINIQNILYPVE